MFDEEDDFAKKNTSEQFDIENSDAVQSPTLANMYHDWFLDYASYVVLERAVPDVVDGLKPVSVVYFML